MITALHSKSDELKKTLSNYGLDTKKVVAALLGAYLLKKILLPGKKIPPGPMALPLIGNLYLLAPPTDPAHQGEMPRTHEIFRQMSKKYGPMFSFWFGYKLTVVINTPTLFHEAMKLQNATFSGRFAPPSMDIITRGKGIALNGNMDAWRKYRSALQKALTGKSQGPRQAKLVEEEVRSTVHMIRKRMDEVKRETIEMTDFRLQMRRESINVIMRSMFSFRYGVGLTPEYRRIDFIMSDSFARIAAGNADDYIPLLRLLPQTQNLRELQKTTDERDAFLFKWLQKARTTLKKGEPRDCLDELLEIQQETGMTDEDIVVICWDSMAGGIDTTAATFEWGAYCLAMHPEVQKKVHEELDRVVGPKRLPTFEDQPKLPYLAATLMEIMRFRHFAPFGIPRCTTEDTQLGGYHIPKDTQVIVNFHALHYDEDWWLEPNKFRPERFLEEDKSLSGAFYHAEMKTDANSMKFAPFGHGRRMCVGYGLARVIAFLKFATHLHCFSYSARAGETFDLEDEHVGITVMPNEYSVQITARPAAALATSIEGKYSEH